MSTLRVAGVYCLAFVGFAKIAAADDTSLERVAQALMRPSSPCPFAVTTKIGEKSGDYVLSFSLRNVSGRTLMVRKWFLPWATAKSTTIAALLTDGRVIVGDDELADRTDIFDRSTVAIRPSQTISGDLQLKSRWRATPLPNTEFPRDSDIVLLWAFSVEEELGGKPLPTSRPPSWEYCSGATAFRSAK